MRFAANVNRNLLTYIRVSRDNVAHRNRLFQGRRIGSACHETNLFITEKNLAIFAGCAFAFELKADS